MLLGAPHPEARGGGGVIATTRTNYELPTGHGTILTESRALGLLSLSHDVEEDRTPKEATGHERFWEVDAARGVAILMMVLYHFLYDLDTFGGYGIESTTGFWARFADLTAFSFVFLVGVSLSISYSRTEYGSPNRNSFGKYFGRGLKILGYGMVLTFATWLAGAGVIVFGILHLIGVSIVLAYPFLSLRLPNLLLGLGIIAVGLYVSSLDPSPETIWLLPFGLVPETLFMPDYRPLLPWFGVVLLGLFVGNILYSRGRRTFRILPTEPAAARVLGPLGRNSLLIYLVHQPVLVGLLALLGIIRVGGF